MIAVIFQSSYIYEHVGVYHSLGDGEYGRVNIKYKNYCNFFYDNMG